MPTLSHRRDCAVIADSPRRVVITLLSRCQCSRPDPPCRYGVTDRVGLLEIVPNSPCVEFRSQIRAPDHGDDGCALRRVAFWVGAKLLQITRCNPAIVVKSMLLRILCMEVYGANYTGGAAAAGWETAGHPLANPPALDAAVPTELARGRAQRRSGRGALQVSPVRPVRTRLRPALQRCRGPERSRRR